MCVQKYDVTYESCFASSSDVSMSNYFCMFLKKNIKQMNLLQQLNQRIFENEL